MATHQQLLPRLRRICLALPETWEGTSFGHPTFYAGKKTFALLESYGDVPCITVKTAPVHQKQLLQDPRFTLAPYSGKHGWVCLRADGTLDWTQVQQLVEESYRLVALKRMLAQLDGPSRRG